MSTIAAGLSFGEKYGQARNIIRHAIREQLERSLASGPIVGTCDASVVAEELLLTLCREPITTALQVISSAHVGAQAD